MIRVNLLPPGVGRQDRAAQLAALPWKEIGTGAGGLLVLVTVGFLLANGLQRRAFDRLNAEWERLQPERVQLDQLRASLDTMRNRQRAIQTLKAEEGKWAPRMELFIDALTANLWFKGLQFKVSRSTETAKFLSDEFRDLIPGIGEMMREQEQMEGPMEAEPSQTPAAPTMNPDGTPARAAPPPPPWQPRLTLRGSALVSGQADEAPVRRFIHRLKGHPEFSRWFSGLELKDVGHEEQGPYEVSEFILILYPTGTP